MTKWTGLIDNPPPAEIVARFGETTAAAVRDFAAMPCDATSRAIAIALQGDREIAEEGVDGVIGERRALLGALLAKLAGEFRGLSEDLGFQRWRSQPHSRYMPVSLNVGRPRPQTLTSCATLLADLASLAQSSANAGSAWDAQMEPPPAEVCRRFSSKLTVAADAWRSNPTGAAQSAVALVLGENDNAGRELDPALIEGKIGERRARIGQIIADLDREFRGFAEDLGVRAWRADPHGSRYMPVRLNIGRRRPLKMVSCTMLLADLASLAQSSTGYASSDGPAPNGRGNNWRPVRVPSYSVGVPGSEAPDTTGRIGEA